MDDGSMHGAFTIEGQQAPENLSRLLPLADLLDDLQVDAAAAHEARLSGKPRGPRTGLPGLDQRLGGYFAPGLHGLLGNTGSGKTAFALQLAASCETPALFVSLEMRPLELLRRLTARLSETFLGRLKSGELSADAVRALAGKAIASCPQLALVDATRAYLAPEQLLEMALAWRRRHAASQLLVVLDSLHAWSDRSPAVLREGRSEYEALSVAMDELLLVSAVLSAPLLFVSEQNRASMGRGGVNSGAGNRRIEYKAETIISLKREPKAAGTSGEDDRPLQAGDFDANHEAAITVTLEKNRNGAAGEPSPLLFHGALQRFREA